MTNPTHGEMLKPCPFCGGSAEPYQSEYGWETVRCQECLTECGPQREAADAIAAWNRRSALVPPEQTEGVVAWTGSGSLTAVERGDQGFIWPSKEPAHPIPLYARPSPAAAHTAEIARLREALGWVISSPHIAREVARAALKTEASVSPAADVAWQYNKTLRTLLPASANEAVTTLLASLSAENAELKRERDEALRRHANQSNYAVDLQRIIEDLCHGLTIRKPQTTAHYHYDMAVAATSTLARMRAALEKIGRMHLYADVSGLGGAIRQHDAAINIARTALKGTAS